MARATGRAAPPVIDRLLERPREFTFVQAVRLLGLSADMRRGERLKEFYRSHLRVRPELSLGFPATDLTDIEILDGPRGPRCRITAAFLGLYGTGSPLPTFYTEDLLDEAGDDLSGLRDFLDILNNGFFIKLFRAWSRNRLHVRVSEEDDQETLERLYCLVGMGHERIRRRHVEAYGALRYIGLITQRPRSAAGLAAMLSDRLEGMPVRISQCLSREAPIAPDQRCLLGVQGCALGESALLGSRMRERMGTFGVEVGPVSCEDFRQLLPGEPLHETIVELTELYVDQPLDWELTLRVDHRQCGTTRLDNGGWNRLGQDTWIFSQVLGEASVTFRMGETGADTFSKGAYA